MADRCVCHRLIQISSYLVTRRALLRWARPVSPETREQIQYCSALGLKRTFQVRRSDRVRTAMVLACCVRCC